MEFKELGNTDIDVSLICLGTMTWGQQNTQEEGFEQMDYALEQGVNFFDTAELYSIPPKAETQGSTETIIGNWFKKNGNRKEIILATKVAGRSGMKWFRGGETRLNKENIEEAIEGSLKRLQTDYIDLYQLHWPERKTNFFGRLGYKNYKQEKDWTPFEEILETAKKFVDQGKIRYLGLSNETPYGLSNYINLSNYKNLPRVMSVQNPYSLLNRTYEVGMSEISIRDQVGLLAYSPLACGVLTGKYRNSRKPEGARLTIWDDWTRYTNERSINATDQYCKIAENHGLTPTELSLAFVNQQDFVTSNIIGATKMDQLKENIKSADIELSKQILDEIDEVHEDNPSPAP